MQSVYFIGIGGIGISALARWFKAHNYEVLGSDLVPSSTTKELVSEGIKIFIGPHEAGHISKNISRVIYNQAITLENPELQKAKELGIPCLSYPQSLGELTKIYKTVAIAGAHGKSTTTSLISLILEKAGFNPTVIIGTKLKEFGGKNFRNGSGEYLVIEADEWKASFLNYFPYAALITNLDKEHLDFYKNFKAIKKCFLQFLCNVNPYGLIVLNKDDKNLRSLSKMIRRPVVWYSLNDKEEPVIRKILKIPGQHNVSNSLGAYTLARALGIPKTDILSVLKSFRGSWRRSEFRGKFLEADIYDDYGHHPTEIRATLQGFKEKFPKKRLICVFQPHQMERLKLLFKDFVQAFNAADVLMLLDIYKVAGREEKNNEINSQKLAAAIEEKTGRTVFIPPDIIALKNHFKNKLEVGKDDIIIMMGAGNINEWTDRLMD